MENLLMKIVMKFIILIFLLQSFGTQLGSMPRMSYAFRTRAYQPLRTFPYFSKLDYELDQADSELLKDIMKNVIIYIRKTLSVIRVNGQLLLEREACQSSWTTGRNSGKCASIKKDYSGEICQDEFLLPDDHLEAFYTWTNDPLPYKTWYTDGNGVNNADFILYIQARTTKSCMTNYGSDEGNELIAYASYCKLGKNERPLAGYINFCPSRFKKYRHDREKLIFTALHEVFHALGFSKDLFLRYKDCSQMDLNGDCPEWGYPILRQHGVNYLLLTPTVVKEMQKHFSCSKQDFGAPLIAKNEKLQSHWNESILPGSIMTANLRAPANTYVDPITLAVFEDTGWYKVNMSNADFYPLGKGSGCDTGLGDKKHMSINSCLNALQQTACDRLDFKSVINCTDIDASSYFQKDDTKMKCDAHFKNLLPKSFNSISGQHAHDTFCLLQSSQNVTEGKCYMIKCLQNGEIWIKVDETNWLDCPIGRTLEIPFTDITVICPDSRQLYCATNNDQLYLENLVLLETTTVTQRPVYIATHNQHRNMYGYRNARNETSQGSPVYFGTTQNFWQLIYVLLIIMLLC